MIAKSSEKRKVAQTDSRGRESSKPKEGRQWYCDQFEYGTGSKKLGNGSSHQLQEIKEIMASCVHCRNKISQFVTQRWTQTTSKPFLIDLIEERVEDICRQNSKMSKLLGERQDEIAERTQQINQIEEKFTSILLNLAQEVCFYKLKQGEAFEMERVVQTDSDTPSYIKALLYDKI